MAIDNGDGRRTAGRINLPSVVDEVVRELRRLILSGTVHLGERLIEERLTAELGVSRPPLREAMRILERDGLVRSLPRRGVIVEPLTSKDVREIYGLRRALERLAVELGVPVDDERRLVPMREALGRMREAAEQGDLDGVVRANAAFHSALVDLPGHRRLSRAYESIAMQLQLCMAINLRFREQQYRDPVDAVRRHTRLLELIEAGDSDAVQQEIRVHGDLSFMDHFDEMIGGTG